VIVRPSGFVTIFSAVEVADFLALLFSETFYVILEVSFVERAIFWKFIIFVCQGEETIIFVEGGLVYTPNSPLSGPFESAAYALATGDRDRLVLVAVGSGEGYTPTRESKALHGVVTGH